MNIKLFSEVVDVSAHTLRYYEKIGLLNDISRTASGHRFFTQKDVEWIRFVKRLKETGMPLETINHYANLRQQGDVTSKPRMRILEEHAIRLKEKIELEALHLKRLEEKIDYYKNSLQAK